ncbi:MAG: Hsp20/alpha crystallin family protein [Bacteriovoracaceae bacterium]|nr:Hsp20/alpha crystallin family protein [Bacteroidota bacterium]
MTNETVQQKAPMIITPAVNILESSDTFIVTLDIPGATKDRIKANIENNSLVIVADVFHASAVENDQSEKQYRREFSLANDIDVDSTDARYDLGVLTITLKKKQQYVPKQIHVN